MISLNTGIVLRYGPQRVPPNAVLQLLNKRKKCYLWTCCKISGSLFKIDGNYRTIF